MAGGLKDDDTEEFKGLRITSLDDESDEEEEQKEQDIVIDEGDEEEEDEEARNSVVLGFVKKPKKARSLLRHFFPSKAGGVPAWLDPENLPSGRSCFCDICDEPLQFVLQVYAPEEKQSAFHRTLFVFMCTSMVCLRRDQHEQWKCHQDKPSRSVKVFRCQLPRDNPFYSSEPPKKDSTDLPLKAGAALCNWCGSWKGIKRCTGCRRALYCSEKHWVKHSRTGHEHDCQQLRISSQLGDSSSDETTPAVLLKVASNNVWPEYKIIQESESSYETDMPDDTVCTNSLVSSNRKDDALMSIAENFEGDDDRKSWASFHERIALAPEQVLRYCRIPGAKPLWPVSSGRPSKADIPKCSYCAGPLCFEFQIMPQLLFYFNVKNDVDSLDWATIAVYTCEASCDASVAYKEEFAWVQLS
ncbi:programmed cell death protein 2-like isoform X2 [Prunus avium]|uniref:Programmed cell death protein 2-like isoform X2 n=1 Tax=Prunus avium TaxID=42229 RepID=A0A6P5SGD2_PRUAV|nr:programmed cell death protein 2-like isoform X2 [Prunus avium]